MELEVGGTVAAVGSGEQERLRDGRGERAAAPEQEVQQRGRLLGVGEGGADRRVPDPDDVGVVLEVRADRRQRRDHVDAEAGELVGVADPREHQQLRRADRTGGEDHLAPGPGDGHVRLTAHLDAADAPRRDFEAVRERAGQDRQVRPAGGGTQEGVGAAPAPAPLLGHLDRGDAVRFAVVVVGIGGIAAPAGGGDHQLGQRARAARRGDVEQAAVAVIGPGSGLVVLGADEVGEDVVPAPALAAGFVAPAVVVGAVAANVEHRVHRARAAERAPARHVEAAALTARLGPARVVPVELRLELLGEGGRDLDLRRAVAAAGLDEEDLGAGVAEPVGEHAAGRSGADDHVVVVAHARSSRFVPAGRS